MHGDKHFNVLVQVVNRAFKNLYIFYTLLVHFYNPVTYVIIIVMCMHECTYMSHLFNQTMYY